MDHATRPSLGRPSDRGAARPKRSPVRPAARVVSHSSRGLTGNHALVSNGNEFAPLHRFFPPEFLLLCQTIQSLSCSSQTTNRAWSPCCRVTCARKGSAYSKPPTAIKRGSSHTSTCP